VLHNGSNENPLPPRLAFGSWWRQTNVPQKSRPRSHQSQYWMTTISTLPFVQTAQAEYDQHKPDVIVGSSRGGAVALNINSKDTPLVLLCPAWKNWGTVNTLKPNSVILHSVDKMM
jgi:hypothetical protein